MKKILILYVFHIFNKRVIQFINNAIIEDENVDYIIISNDKNRKLTSLPSYVKTLYRENLGYDFGGWSEALLTNNLYQNCPDNRQELIQIKTHYEKLFTDKGENIKYICFTLA